MNENGEKRLCKQCGKRLPSSNNFCMFCGCNNNLINEEVNTPAEQNNQTTNDSKNVEKKENNPIVNRDKSPLKILLIYVFIFLDIIAISATFFLKSDGLFYRKFSYDLDSYDKVINLNNVDFLVLKNNKIKVLTTNKNFDNKSINECNKEKVLDIVETYPGSQEIYIETSKTIYRGLYYDIDFYLKDLKVKKITGNIYKDINIHEYNTTEDDEYYGILQYAGYYIKNDELYKYEKSKDRLSSKYASTKILSKKELNMKNPEIIGASYNQSKIIIKGDNIIKIFEDGVLVESISSITINNRTYKINDLKYVLFTDDNFSFVCKNGYPIHYRYSIKNSSVDSYYDSYYKEKTKPTVNPKDLNKNIVVKDNNYTKISFFKINKDDFKSILILLAFVIAFLGIMYYFRNSNIIISILIATGVVFIYMFILSVYTYKIFADSLTMKEIWELLKDMLRVFPKYFLYGIYLAQIKEITKYITNKLNIETIYHFCLAFAAIACFLYASAIYTDSAILMSLPGIAWAFMTLNKENHTSYIYNNKFITQLVSISIINLILCFIITSIFAMNEYYVCNLIIAFCISYSLILDQDMTTKNYIIKVLKACSYILCAKIALMISGVISLFGTKSDSFFKELGSMLKIYFAGSIIRIVMIVGIGFIIAIALNYISKGLKKWISSTNNRIINVLLTMLGMIVLVSIFILLLPYIEIIISKIRSFIVR